MDETKCRLVHACLEGHKPAWEELVRKYTRMVWSLCRDQGLAPDLAADAHQSTFLIIFRKLHRLRDPNSLTSWVAQIARREALAVLRATQARWLPNRKELVKTGNSGPEKRLELIELAQVLSDALDTLPDRYRSVLRAMFYCRAPSTYKDIATSLGVPIGSLGPLRHRGLEMLRSRLEPQKHLLLEQFGRAVGRNRGEHGERSQVP